MTRAEFLRLYCCLPAYLGKEHSCRLVTDLSALIEEETAEAKRVAVSVAKTLADERYRLNAALAAPRERVERLERALLALADWNDDARPTERFEALAQEFYGQTRIMAPGKSVAPEMWASQPPDDVRADQWRKFVRQKHDALVAAARAALETPPPDSSEGRSSEQAGLQNLPGQGQHLGPSTTPPSAGTKWDAASPSSAEEVPPRVAIRRCPRCHCIAGFYPGKEGGWYCDACDNSGVLCAACGGTGEARAPETPAPAGPPRPPEFVTLSRDAVERALANGAKAARELERHLPRRDAMMVDGVSLDANRPPRNREMPAVAAKEETPPTPAVHGPAAVVAARLDVYGEQLSELAERVVRLEARRGRQVGGPCHQCGGTCEVGRLLCVACRLQVLELGQDRERSPGGEG